MISVDTGLENAVDIYYTAMDTDFFKGMPRFLLENRSEPMYVRLSIPESYGIYTHQLEQARHIARTLFAYMNNTTGHCAKATLDINIPVNLKYGQFWKKVRLDINDFTIDKIHFNFKEYKRSLNIHYDPINSNLPDELVISIAKSIDITNFEDVMTILFSHELTHAYEDYYLGGNKISSKLGDMYYIGITVNMNKDKFSDKTRLFANLAYHVNPEESNSFSSQLTAELRTYKPAIKDTISGLVMIKNTYVYRLLKNLEFDVNRLRSFTDTDYEEIYNELRTKIFGLPTTITVTDIKNKAKIIMRDFSRLKNHIECNAGKAVADILGLR